MEQIKQKLKLPPTSMDTKVDLFLIDIANDFIHNSLSKTKSLKHIYDDEYKDEYLLKYSMSIFNKSLCMGLISDREKYQKLEKLKNPKDQ